MERSDLRQTGGGENRRLKDIFINIQLSAKTPIFRILIVKFSPFTEEMKDLPVLSCSERSEPDENPWSSFWTETEEQIREASKPQTFG